MLELSSYLLLHMEELDIPTHMRRPNQVFVRNNCEEVQPVQYVPGRRWPHLPPAVLPGYWVSK